MFNRLQEKWQVSGWRLLVILMVFAIGGSLTGYVGKELMSWLGIQKSIVYIIIYVIVVTIIWPIMVTLVSIPFGQFFFFKKYIAKLRRRVVFGKSPMSKSQSANLKRLVVFASGAGSNARQLITHFKTSPIAKVALIVCNKPGAGVISVADQENVPVLLIEKERFFNEDAYLPELKKAGADLIILAGFLWKIPAVLIDVYPRRIINIHPALLPMYGGKGMYGQHVHEAVLNSGEVQSGITIHYVDEHYDNGDIIFQTACPVLQGDTPQVLAQRIHQLEHLHYPRVIEKIAAQL